MNRERGRNVEKIFLDIQNSDFLYSGGLWISFTDSGRKTHSPIMRIVRWSNILNGNCKVSQMEVFNRTLTMHLVISLPAGILGWDFLHLQRNYWGFVISETCILEKTITILQRQHKKISTRKITYKIFVMQNILDEKMPEKHRFSCTVACGLSYKTNCRKKLHTMCKSNV